MDVRTAVDRAVKGDAQGFAFLYEETYQKKYYLALQYMKNKEAAEDVLQEAYLKAFQKINTLQNPEAFEGWLGMIIANTAKNALAKKNAMLFSELAVDEEGEEYVYDVEDEDPGKQPEQAYSREETRQLVHTLMDTLSEEQRMCILMFHIENASISEIANTMNCSENTVKSRLNYGRKNLRTKAEELQKKGYRLYSVAPIPLLLYLLRSDQEAFAMQKMVAASGKNIELQVLHKLSGKATGAGKITGAGKAAMAGKTAATGKMIAGKMAAGKIAAAVIATSIAGVGSYGIYTLRTDHHIADQIERVAVTAQMTDDTSSDSTKDAGQKESTDETTKKDTEKKEPTQKNPSKAEIRTLYEKVLTDVQNGKYTFAKADSESDYQYFLTDIDGDQIPELGVGPKWSAGAFFNYDLKLFSCKQTSNGYELVTVSGDEVVTSLYVAKDGSGLYDMLTERGTGMCEVHPVRINKDILTYGNVIQTFQLGDADASAFEQKNQGVQWKSITDQSDLSKIQ